MLDMINRIIREKLGISGEISPIYLREREDLTLEYVVHGQIYQDLDTIDDLQVQELIQSAIKDWEEGFGDSAPDPESELPEKLTDLFKTVLNGEDIDRENPAEIREEMESALNPAQIIRKANPPSRGDFYSLWVKEIMALTYLQRQIAGLAFFFAFPVFPLISGIWLFVTGRFQRQSYILKGFWALSSLLVAIIVSGLTYRAHQILGWEIFSWSWAVPLILYIPLAVLGFYLAGKDYLAEDRAGS